MAKINHLILCLLAMSLLIVKISADDHDKTVEQIIKDYGFPLEKYYVTTADGYILNLWRIPYGAGQSPSSNRRPVLFQHGGFDSADALFNHGPKLSPAFYLANEGYDVWIGNARGDKYSRNHTTLNPDTDAKFWDWTFTDRFNDDKANIEFIRQKTSGKDIAFIGHSEGFSAMLYSLTTNQADWFKSKLSVVVGLAPVSKMDGLKSTLLRILGMNDFAIGLVRALGIHEWFYPNIYTRTLFVNICKYVPEICMFNMKYITDGDPSVNDRESFRSYMGHFPGGLSVKLLDHELQLYRAAKFQQYDYGKEGNLETYGTETPPTIPVDKISGVNIAMMVGTSDLLGTVEDNRWLKNQLGDNVKFYKEYEYGCSSFYVAKDMSYLEDLLKFIENYN